MWICLGDGQVFSDEHGKIHLVTESIKAEKKITSLKVFSLLLVEVRGQLCGIWSPAAPVGSAD